MNKKRALEIVLELQALNFRIFKAIEFEEWDGVSFLQGKTRELTDELIKIINES